MLNLTDEDYQTLQDILHSYLSRSKVYAFGSRVSGRNHQWSDLDLYIEGENPVSSELKEALSESDLSIFVDIVDSHMISPTFRDTLMKSEIVLIATIE